MLTQGNMMGGAKPIAFASRTTTKAEHKYPKLDLEARAVDFCLRRFRDYIVGEVSGIADHKPLNY